MTIEPLSAVTNLNEVMSNKLSKHEYKREKNLITMQCRLLFLWFIPLKQQLRRLCQTQPCIKQILKIVSSIQKKLFLLASKILPAISSSDLSLYVSFSISGYQNLLTPSSQPYCQAAKNMF